MKSMFRIIFVDIHHTASYISLFLCGALVPFTSLVDMIIASIGLLTITAITSGIVVSIVFVSFFKLSLFLIKKNWWFAVAQIAVLPVAGMIFVLGTLAGRSLAIALEAPIISRALAEYRAGIELSNSDVEIISVDPDIAVYKLGYDRGFLSPGASRYLVFDASGRFADAARNRHSRDLAASQELKQRNYKAYCRLHLTHWLGYYYFAMSDDLEECESN